MSCQQSPYYTTYIRSNDDRFDEETLASIMRTHKIIGEREFRKAAIRANREGKR